MGMVTKTENETKWEGQRKQVFGLVSGNLVELDVPLDQ